MHTAHVPISFAQQHLLSLDKLDLLPPGNHSRATLRLHGELDVELLERSFTTIVRRHEILRTRFDVTDGAGVQIIDPPANFPLQLIDLRGIEPDVRERKVTTLERRHRERAFDLARGPLLRACVLRVGKAEHVLQIVMHSMISDDWSMGILLRELGALYSASAAGDAVDLPPLEWQYADYSHWQHELQHGPAWQAHLTYWEQQLRASSRSTELPTDRPRALVRSGRRAVHRFAWPIEMGRRLHHMSHSHGATVFMLVLCALQVLLGRWSRNNDVIVVTAVAGRTRRELTSLIGLFVNYLPLHADLSDNPSVSKLLGRIRRATYEAHARQELPFGELQAALRLRFDRGKMPMFQVLLTMDAVARHTFDATGISVSSESVGCPAAHFDAAVDIAHTANGMQGRVEYAPELHDAKTIERFTRELENILAQMIERPGARLSELILLGPP